MKKNIGTGDRLLRLFLALVLLALSWWGSSWILLVCGLFVLYEAFASWCLLYQLLGKNSCSINRK